MHNGLRTLGYSQWGKNNMVSWQELLLRANMDELRCAMPRSRRDPQAQVMPSLWGEPSLYGSIFHMP